MRKLSKEYYWNNREQNLKYAKNWRKNNPEIAKLCMKKCESAVIIYRGINIQPC